MRKETALNNRTTFFAEWLTLADTHLKTQCEKLAFFDAVLRYGLTGEYPRISGKALACFELAKRHMEDLKYRRNNYRCKKANGESTRNLQTISNNSSDNLPTIYTPFIVNEDVKSNTEQSKNELKLKEKEQEKESFSKKDFEDLMPDHLKNDPVFRAEWSTWLSYRRGTHRSVSRAAASRQLKLLGDYEPHDAILIIENSITNDWQGLFPAKTKNLKPRRDYTCI